MLGMRIAGAYPAPLRWVYRLFGFLNIHDRQRWALLWPRLAAIGKTRRLRVLDIGCGSGRWALELAARMPRWVVTGVDRNRELIRRADQRRRLLCIENARFVAADCLEFPERGPYDLVLSVNSAHYALPAGNGGPFFRRLAEWLEPDTGVLILFAPSCISRRDAIETGDSPRSPGFVSIAQIVRLCDEARLRVEHLTPCIGRLGIFAKQLALLSERGMPLAAALYPAQLALSCLDRRMRAEFRTAAALLLIAVPGTSLRTLAPDVPLLPETAGR